MADDWMLAFAGPEGADAARFDRAAHLRGDDGWTVLTDAGESAAGEVVLAVPGYAEVWLQAVLVLAWGWSVVCCVWIGCGKMCEKLEGLWLVVL